MIPAQAHRTVLLRPVGATDEGVELRAHVKLSVGRDSVNRLQIAHRSVWPFHCRFELLPIRLRRDGVERVEWRAVVVPQPDAPVRVNGSPIDRATPLAAGAVVRIGEVPFEVFAGKSASLTPVPFREELQRELREVMLRVPWFAISLAVHFGVLWWVARGGDGDEETRRPLAIHSEFIDPVVPIPETPLPPSPETIEAPPEPEDPSVETELGEELAQANLTPIEALALPVDAESWASGLGGGSNGGLSEGGRVDLDRTLGSNSALGRQMHAMRGAGLDLMIVIDTTSSMNPFLDNARRVLDRWVTTLGAMVPDLRIGVVAYRDRDPVDEYVTQILELGSDRYRLLAFLEELTAVGGGDLPEAVDAGLDAAFEGAGWRNNSFRTVLLVGDAKPHDHSFSAIERSVRRFRSNSHETPSRISVLYVGRDGPMGSDDRRGLARIASLGDGTFLALEAGGDDLESELLVMTFGHEFEEELAHLRSSVREDPRTRLVERKIAEGDVRWLLTKLRSPVVHPRVVEGLRTLWDAEVRRQVARLLNDPDTPAAAFWAARYLMQKASGESAPLRGARDRSPRGPRSSLRDR